MFSGVRDVFPPLSILPDLSHSNNDRRLRWHKLGHIMASHVDKAPLCTHQAAIHYINLMHTRYCLTPHVLCVGTTSSQCYKAYTLICFLNTDLCCETIKFRKMLTSFCMCCYSQQLSLFINV